MNKYRNLTHEELELLEKDFVEFLVVNGITADNWVKLKSQDPIKVTRMIELFSEVVFEKIMRKTKYLTKRLGAMLMCFHYDEELAHMILVPELETDIPTQDIVISDMPLSQLSYQKKSYQKSREQEIFDLIQGGAEVSDGQLYQALLEHCQVE